MFFDEGCWYFFPLGTPPLTPVQHIYSSTVQHILCETKGEKSRFYRIKPRDHFSKRKWFCSQDPTRAQNTIKKADYISSNCYCLNTITSNSQGDFLLMERCVAPGSCHPCVCLCLRGRPCSAYLQQHGVCMHLFHITSWPRLDLQNNSIRFLCLITKSEIVSCPFYLFFSPQISLRSNGVVGLCHCHASEKRAWV